MSASVDVLHPERPKRIAMVASNPAVSEQTGLPIGFWWAELAHPFWELSERGYDVDVASPEGGPLRADAWSDPRDKSGYSAEDLLSLGFINSPAHMKLVEESKPLAAVAVDDYDGILFVGGQGPMYTFVDDERVHALVASFYEAGKVTSVICHATSVLLRTRLADGRLHIGWEDLDRLRQLRRTLRGRLRGTESPGWFWIEEEARQLESTNFIVSGRFKPHAVRDGNLITGQQQYSGKAAARLMIEALGT